MIPLTTLQYLRSQRVKDADTLFRHGRNNGALYLMGYALEFSLKRKISLTFGFARGFPETSIELSTYTSQVNRFHALQTGVQLNKIGQLRHHRLNDLLTYSGERPRIMALYHPEWLAVSQWNPENRYIRQRVTQARAAEFMRSAKLILKEIS